MPVQPLPERIESTRKHDPYINVRFVKMFDHPDNAEIRRTLEVGLAINDPALPDDDTDDAACCCAEGEDDDDVQAVA